MNCPLHSDYYYIQEFCFDSDSLERSSIIIASWMIIEILIALFVFHKSIKKGRKISTFNPFSSNDKTYCVLSMHIHY